MNNKKAKQLLTLATLSAVPIAGLVAPSQNQAQAQRASIPQVWQTGKTTLVSTREYPTKASADAAAAQGQKQGYKTYVAYDANRKVYVLREYSVAASPQRPVFNPTAPYPPTTNPVNPTKPTPVDPNPVLSRRDFSTKAAADAAAAERTNLGFYTTVVYDAQNRVYILREYAHAPGATTTPTGNPVVSERRFSTKASADAAAAARTKLGFYTTVDYDAKDRVYILREYATAPVVTTNPVLSERPFGTKASADAAAAARTKLGLYTTVNYDAARKVYILREYATAPKVDPNPVLSQREFGTKASADAAAAARSKLGFYTTVVYDAKNRVYILREYKDTPTGNAQAAPKPNPVLSQRQFSTQASANAAAAARQKLGFKTTVVYDAQKRVYILREYKGN